MSPISQCKGLGELFWNISSSINQYRKKGNILRIGEELGPEAIGVSCRVKGFCLPLCPSSIPREAAGYV